MLWDHEQSVNATSNMAPSIRLSRHDFTCHLVLAVSPTVDHAGSLLLVGAVASHPLSAHDRVLSPSGPLEEISDPICWTQDYMALAKFADTDDHLIPTLLLYPRPES